MVPGAWGYDPLTCSPWKVGQVRFDEVQPPAASTGPALAQCGGGKQDRSGRGGDGFWSKYATSSGDCLAQGKTF